ncbi:MAG TPA: putative Ig domain-containing protein [Streptosporangiaceae bacterium]
MMTIIRRWAGWWVLSLAVALVVAFVLPGSASAASSAPARSAAAAQSATPVQMNYACTSKVTGLVRYVSSPTQCTKNENAVTIVPGPVYLCVYFGFAVRQVAAAKDCPSGAYLKEVTLPPTSGPVYFCALKLDGLLTYTTNPSKCNTSVQFPVVVPVPNKVTVTNPGNQTGTVGTAVSLQIQASDSASGQTLTYSAAGLPAGLSIASSTGLISGTPTTAGTSSVTVTATDTTGASGSASFTWTINPAPPTAVNQSYTAVGNTTLAVGTTVTGPAATVSGSLLNGDSGPASCGTLSVTGNTAPAHGTVTVNSDGTFTYLPAAGFTGTDTFQYTITCGTSGATASATVTITVGTVVWYVDDSQSAAGTGESNAPFNTLAAANSAVGANSIVFLYQGNATYTGGLTMKSGDDLWGQPHGLTVGSYDLVAPGGSNPTITNTSSGGDGIDLASNTDIENVTVSGANTYGINGQQVTGTVTIANSTVTTAGVDNAIITDTSGTLNLTVTGSTFSNSTASDTSNNSSYGLIVNANGSTNATVSVTGSTLTGNTGDEFSFATASGATGTDSVTFSNNQVSGVGIHGGGGSGAAIAQLGNNTTTVTIDGNNIQNVTANGIGVDNEGSGTVSGTINANTVGSPTVANSGGSNSISATAEGAGTETLAITSNKLYQYDDFAGIYYIDREGSPTLNLTITGNTLADPAGNATQGGAWGIYGEAGAATGDAGKVCAAITGNSLTGAGQTSLGSADIELDQNVAAVTYELPGYTGGATDTTAVQTFVAGNNNGGGTPSVVATVIGAPGFVGGSSCPAP